MDGIIDLDINRQSNDLVAMLGSQQRHGVMGAQKVKMSDVRCPICERPCSYHTPVNLTLCRQCGHLFQSDKTVTILYDGNYAHHYDNLPVTELSNVRWNFIQKCLNLPIGSKILDIGYGNGAFLKRAREQGMEIYGIDLHSEDFGIPNVAFDSPLSYDLVCFFDSLEHFPTFREIFSLTSKNVVVSVPNPPDLFMSTPRAWRHYKPGEHLHYFSIKSLGILLQRLGYGIKLAQGFPEDEVRGKLPFDRQRIDNIYTTIYAHSAKRNCQ